MIVDEKTYESPFNRAINPETFAASSADQVDLARHSFAQFVDDAFERNLDLRGVMFEVIVHKDGLFCTVRRHGT